jgi:hypothetical protein
MNTRIVLAVLGIAGLAGCASTNPLEGMSSIATPRTVVFDRAISGTEIKWKTEYILSSGRYEAVQENAKGTLFRGPQYGLIYNHLHGYMLRSGGLWVPRDPQGKPYIYGYFSQDVASYPDLSSALAAQASRQTALAGPDKGQSSDIYAAKVSPPCSSQPLSWSLAF